MLAHPFLYVPLLRLQRTSAQTRYGLQLFYHQIKTSRLRPRPRTVSLSVPRTNKYAGQRHCCWLSGQTRLWSDLAIDRSFSQSSKQSIKQPINQSWDVLRWCDESVCLCVCQSVCLFVCLSAHISQKPHIQTSRKFLYTLPRNIARSSFDDFRFCEWHNLFS